MSEKQEEASLRAGQFWVKGTVERYGPVTRGSYTANILQVYAPNERNPKYPDTFFVKVLDKAAEKLTAKPGDEVELTCYVSSRLNKAGDGAWVDCVLAFCEVLSSSGGLGGVSSDATDNARPDDDSMPF